MRILIFGGNGMAGHMIKEYLTTMTNYDVWYTSREVSTDPKCLFVDVTEPLKVVRLLEVVSPRIVINAVGLLNHQAERYLLDSIYVNSWFPHRLAVLGNRNGFHVIHISTDCVFSGKRGDYTENDLPDGTTVYARTKILGEIHDPNHLTIRTSIIGPENKPNGIGLFHWFMMQSGEIPGYTRVYWNGVTTLELAKAIDWSISQKVTGLVHLAAPQKISKYELLLQLQHVFQRDDLQIRPDAKMISDKSLVNTRSDFTYSIPSYAVMLHEMKQWIENRDERILEDD